MALTERIGRPEPEEPEQPRGRGRKIARYAVPVAVAGVAAATITLVPALADAGTPSLPKITAQQLLTKIAASHTRTLDGTVKVSTDLGLPDALSGGAADGLLSGAGQGGGNGGSGSGSSAAPQTQLVQLLAGTHQLHVSVDGPDRQKVSVIEPTAEYSVIHNGTQLWAYDSASNQAYHATLPAADGADRAGGADGTDGAAGVPTTPQAAAEQVLAAARGTASITVDGTARVAGRSAYELVVTPEHADRTTVGSVRIAVDSGTGVPLKFTLLPKGGGKAVFDIGFTKVGFGRPAASTFAFSAPKGAEVTEGKASDASGGSGSGALSALAAPTVLGTGWDSIAVIDTGGAGTAATKGSGGQGGADAQSLLDSYGTKVTGSFGTGTVFHTRLVNVLLTDKGTLYAGAVTQSALTQAAADGAK
ncbi:LolA family protein [Actinacidiphila sp. bgisy144]|uniref:LolA family protein n=1 Tax=Actinacidiphila sp. bgisy144 TaxID=3413791 RepID=UPI003EBA9395